MTSLSTQTSKQPVFTDNAATTAQPDRYVELVVDGGLVLREWRKSLLAHELVDANGFVKGDEDITPARLERRQAVRARLASGETLEKPILGIGIFDNVEIGAGADTLATLVMEGIGVLPVHVRASQVAEFAGFKVN